MSVNHIYSSDEFFGQVTERKCWTAWRTEERTNQKGEIGTTKVPYSKLKVKSESDDPTTWITIEAAAKVAATDGFINNGGGIGIFLGIDCGNGNRLGGTDLDSCLSEEEGTISAWAREILDHFDSYAEVSPSRQGVKIYFLYRDDDLDEIRRITGTKWSRNFKERTGSNHAPGFELHLGNRYFAITGDLYHGSPEAIALIEVEDIRWLIQEMGARFAKPTTASSNGVTHDGSVNSHADNSRSARAMRSLKKLYHEGVVDTEEEGKERLLRDEDPDIVAWMHEKGLTNNEREYARVWKKITKEPRDIDRIRRELQEGDGFVLSPTNDALFDADAEEAIVDENDEPVVSRTDEKLVSSDPPVLSSTTPSLSAREFIRRQDTAMRFWRDDFYCWTGIAYQRVEDAEVKAKVRWFLDHAVTQQGKGFATNSKAVAEVIDALKAYLLEVSHTEPDSDPNLISFQNGVLHMSPPRELLAHDPHRFSLHSLPFDYDRTLPPPAEWMKFLCTLYPDRDDYIDLIQEIIGYYVSGRTDMQKIFLVTGPARAGKGTISWVIRKLLGEKYIANLTLDKFSKDFGMQGLIGKTALIIPDARQGRVNLSVVTERLLNISGEDPIAIARKFKDDWDGMLRTRVMILSNEVPRLPDATGTIATRFIPVRLLISFLGREDKFLKDRLRPELPQIMNWALQGLDRLNERGFFLIPEDAHETIEKLRHAATPAFEFKEDHLIIDPEAVTYKQRVYERFCGYLLSKGHERVSETKFSIDLQALIPGLTECRPRVNGRPGPRMWKGIRLIDENDPSLHSQWDDYDASNDRQLCDREFEANGILPQSMKDLRDSEVMRIRDKIREQIPVLVKEQFDARNAVHEQMASIFPSGNGYAKS